MSKARIEQYYREVEDAIQFGGSDKESSIRRYFANLVEHYAKPKKLNLIDERGHKNMQGKTKFPDGSLQYKAKTVGYWESKDVHDDLEKEIVHKFAIGYPQWNILFENSEKAILFQAPNKLTEGKRVLEINMKNWKELHEILNQFITYETEEIRNFREALEGFAASVPKISKLLKAVISISAGKTTIEDYDTATQMLFRYLTYNPEFVAARDNFLRNCKMAIHEGVTLGEVDEMIVQHILTENIFNTIFGQTAFHQENTIAYELGAVIRTFFQSEIRENTTDQLRNIYEKLQEEAKQIQLYQEKQKFLKLIYEEFYKAYNEKGADRLGIVYTPNEIVQFMLKATNQILHEHFKKTFANEGVEILDPSTGTGTFICDLIEMLPKKDLENKFLTEIHANEVSILAYYIANLNIEQTFKEKMGYYKRFKNICFVDTLDILTHAGNRSTDVQQDMYSISVENLQRIQNQSRSKISVIIGNPPYNANQQNENDNNKNREYLRQVGKNQFVGVDQRIKETYIKESTAQKTKQYDMYKRFLRWSSDRIDENGMISFIVNRAFIDKRQDDGFRKCISKEFDVAYIIDLGGDLRSEGAEATDNVFGIMIGVAIMFLVKKTAKKAEKKRNCRIYYHKTDTFLNKKEKLNFLAMLDFEEIDFEEIEPDKKGNWINQTDNDFEDLIPICSKETKLGKGGNAIFELTSVGINTARDEWVFDFDKNNLTEKANFFIDFLEKEKTRWQASDKKENIQEFADKTIKWSESLFSHLLRWAEQETELDHLQSLPPNGKREKIRKLKEKFKAYKSLKFQKIKIVPVLYRPFVQKWYYAEKILSDRLTKNHYLMFGKKLKEILPVITISQGNRGDFYTLSAKILPNLDIYMPNAANCLPLYRYENGEKVENITNWALDLFRNFYTPNLYKALSLIKVDGEVKIEKNDIFHYVYAVLHDPKYRQKYEQNLKREFPRIPLYENFWKWANAGKKLMDLHLNYEKIEERGLRVEDRGWSFEGGVSRVALSSSLSPLAPRTKLKANKETGEIYIDEQTTLTGVPPIAWEYKLGNRSALEWVLDQYKESKPSDPTILEKFNTYHFADYKEEVIELLQKICYVLMETMQIINNFVA